MTMQSKVELYFRDKNNGMMFSFLDKNTLSNPTEEFFADFAEDERLLIADTKLSETYMHENCGMVTGSYLIAEILRYERTGSKDALENARKCFHGLYGNYRRGFELEPGFFPKSYGGRFSPETSTDQVLYCCCGCEAYYPYATTEEQAMAIEVISALVKFWVKRDYRYHFFKICGDNWQWPLVRFPALLMLAWKFTNDPVFKNEYDRLRNYSSMPEHCQLLQRKQENNPTEFEKENSGWLTFNGADRVTMDTMNFDLLLRHAPEDPLSEKWREGIRIMWDEVKDSIAPDGKYYSMQIFDFETGIPRRTKGFSLDGSAMHGAKSGWSTMVVRAGLMALRHCPELAGEVIPLAKNVFEHIGFKDCTYYDEPERFEPRYRFKTKLLSGDSAANWLWGWELFQQYEAAYCSEDHREANCVEAC